jgi:hypothetical protein
MGARNEPRQDMSITISLPPEMEEKLRQRAAERGQTVDGYVRQLVEREVLDAGGPRPGGAPPLPARLPSDEALAPFRKEVAESGMTDDELLEFFEGVREEVYQEKHGRPGKAS